jgi:hypothetical protein
MTHMYRPASSELPSSQMLRSLTSSSTFLVALTGFRVCVSMCRKMDADVTLDLANQKIAKPAIIDYACSFTRSLDF